jgi:hypothetical protein
MVLILSVTVSVTVHFTLPTSQTGRIGQLFCLTVRLPIETAQFSTCTVCASPSQPMSGLLACTVRYCGSIAVSSSFECILVLCAIQPSRAVRPIPMLSRAYCCWCKNVLLFSIYKSRNSAHRPLIYDTISVAPSFDSPNSLSTNTIGTSPTVYPFCLALTMTSI